MSRAASARPAKTRRSARALTGAALLLAAASAGLLFVLPQRRAVTHTTRRMSTRVESVGRSPACGSRRTSPLDYPWPVRPFDVQHPIRGNFGDPRTVSLGPFGADGAGSPGSFSFHNGVDIAAAPGTPVYPVVSGTAFVRRFDEVIVRSAGRDFQYWHLRASVRSGEPVTAGTTVLGHVRRPADHVHLSEIDHGHVTNPARHLRPYDDDSPPFIRAIELRTTTGTTLPAARLTGRVEITTEAGDAPSLPPNGSWSDADVAPALIRWRLLTGSGVPVAGRTAADFLLTEPPNSRFWNVYAAGTFQNFPVFDNHLYWRQPGRYLYHLTARPLNTRRLQNGNYNLQVTAADLCGNTTTVSQPVTISNPPARGQVAVAAVAVAHRTSGSLDPHRRMPQPGAQPAELGRPRSAGLVAAVGVGVSDAPAARRRRPMQRRQPRPSSKGPDSQA